MALDGAFLSVVKKELDFLSGGRVDKIHQPGRDEIIVVFRAKGGNHKLLLSANPNAARAHITKTNPENPKTPPMFCVLLRKHLVNGKLVSIRQEGLERILWFDFECSTELGDAVKITLAIEIMGRHSNIILIKQSDSTEGKGVIIDSIKRVNAEMSRERVVLPGGTYEYPPRDNRLDFRLSSQDELRAALERMPDDRLSKCLIKAFEGISPIIAREWVFYAARGIDIAKSEMTNDIFTRLNFAVKNSASAVNDDSCVFTVLKDREGTLKDFSFIPVNQYGSLMVSKTFESACGTLDYFYEERDSHLQARQKAADLYRLLISVTDRVDRRLQAQKEELLVSENRDSLKLMGDLISANMYDIEKGQSCAKLRNFYSESNEEIKVPLDVRLTPSQNMQKYYSDYRKADPAEKMLRKLIAQGEDELKYIDSVYDSLTRARDSAEIAEIRAELAEQGYIKSAKSKLAKDKSKVPKSSPPLEFVSPDGFKILAGRNNRQNDSLTCKSSEKTDIWLHTKDIPGSHVIIKTNGVKDVPESTIYYAAQIAAQNSKAKKSSQVPVDYVPVKFVKKPSGAKPGMVIFTNNRTLYVSPAETE